MLFEVILKTSKVCQQQIMKGLSPRELTKCPDPCGRVLLNHASLHFHFLPSGAFTIFLDENVEISGLRRSGWSSEIQGIGAIYYVRAKKRILQNFQ